MPSVIFVQKGTDSVSTNTAMVLRGAAERMRLKSYPISDAASIICLRFASLTRPLPDRALETVAVERQSFFAISLIVTISTSPL